MSKLTEAQQDQIRSMREEGKSYKEIKEFFRETYSMKIYDGKIAKVCGGTQIKKPAKKLAKKEVECELKPICKFIELCEPRVCIYARR